MLGALVAACAGGGSTAETDDIVAQIPFVDGERFVYDLIDRDGVLVGRGVFETTRAGDAFELVQTYEELGVADGERARDEVVRVTVDASTLRPRSMERTRQERDPDDDLEVTASYEPDPDGGLRVEVVTLTGDDERTRELEVREVVYEDQSSLWVWRAIDLREGYEARYTSVDPREGSQVVASITVVEREERTTPAGTFDTWLVQIRTGRETANVWIHAEPPHEVVRFDNGRLFFDLVSE